MALGVTVDVNMNMVKLSGQVDKLAGTLDKFQVRAESMSSKVNRAFSAIGVGVSVAGIAAFVKSGIDAADALHDMADRTGIAVEKLAGFQLATKLADTDMEAFARSANKLSIYIAKNGEEMKALGISAKDPGEAFLQLADVFSKIEDPQKRAALGAAVLGKSYAEMAPLLLQGGAALREQIKTGQEMSGITTEQAKAAADFNDKLDAMTHHLSTVSITVTGPVLTGFNQLIDRINAASKSGITFNSVLQGIGDFAFGRMDDDIERIGTLSAKIDGINEKIVAAKEHLKSAQEWGTSDAHQEIAEKKLNALLFERKTLLLEISNARSKPAQAADGAVDQAAINKVIAGGDGADKATKDKTASVEQLARKYDDLVAGMQREISLRGDNTEAAKMEYEVINGSLAGLAEGQKLKLLNLAAEKDAIELNTKTYQEYDQVITDGLELAKNQRADMSADFDRLNQKFNGKSLDFNKGLADAMDARRTFNPDTGKTIIPDDAALKKVLDKMGRDYNAFADDANDSNARMSEFAVQAAHNMGSAFTDFLFDPFKDGLVGMADGFATALRRMAADALSAQLAERLMGKKGDFQGGWIESAVSGIAGLFSASAGGGSSATMTMSGGPGWFADGGDHRGGYRIVGEKGPELEATGPSRIFNYQQTKNLFSGADSGRNQAASHTIIVNVNGSNNAPDVRRAAGQGAREALSLINGANRYA